MEAIVCFQFYIVTKVRQDLTPLSPFPSPHFTSYAQYYKKRYSLRIKKMDQPLLEVKVVLNKENHLYPRGAGGRRQQQENYEHLIPELCVKLDFPPALWLKAMCLPSVLHRVTQILQAEQLRLRIVHDTGVGRLHLKPGRSTTKQI